MEMKTNPVFRDILDTAQAAGREAGASCRPTPVAFVASGLDNKPLPGAVPEVVHDGVCGFAWVHIKGNTAFGRWAKREGHAFTDYPSGLLLRVQGNYNQSMERKLAHARVMADVLKHHGIPAYAVSRLD